MPSSVEIPADYDLTLMGAHRALDGVELPSSYSPEALAALLDNFRGKRTSPEVARIVERLSAFAVQGVDETQPAALVAAQCLQMSWWAWEKHLSEMLEAEAGP